MSQEYSIGAGYNALSLDTIEDIRVSGKPLLSSVVGLGSHTEGTPITTLDGLVIDDGYASWIWMSASMWPSELKYFKDTYLAGHRSGYVTVRTRRNDATYATYNAVLTFPQNLQLRPGLWYEDVEWRFTQGEVIDE